MSIAFNTVQYPLEMVTVSWFPFILYRSCFWIPESSIQMCTSCLIGKSNPQDIVTQKLVSFRALMQRMVSSSTSLSKNTKKESYMIFLFSHLGWPNILICLKLKDFLRCGTFNAKIGMILVRSGWLDTLICGTKSCGLYVYISLVSVNYFHSQD